jgi:PEP-CTERM motif
VAAGALSFASQASATTTVATISGSYDLLFYDTPALTIHNTSGGTLDNASIFLKGYQPGTLNNGITLLVNLGNLAPGDTNEIWGFLPGFGNFPTSGPHGNLASYDYDDEWGNTPPGFTSPNCTVGAALCSLVGNFSVTFNATVSGGTFNGDGVSSVFSPTTNFTGGFVGWEGLDPTGLSETSFDAHSGSITGTLAEINLGSAPIPEPSTWAMMLLGFAGLGYAGYRANKGARSAALA